MLTINTRKRLSQALIGVLLYGLPVMSVAKEPRRAPASAREEVIGDVNQHQVGAPQVLEIPPVQEPIPPSNTPSSNPPNSIPERSGATGSLPSEGLRPEAPAPSAMTSQRVYLGLLYATAEDRTGGVKVLDVIPGSPAARAGFEGANAPRSMQSNDFVKIALVALMMSPVGAFAMPLLVAHNMYTANRQSSAGDLIVAIGDRQVRDAMDFSQELHRYQPGDTVIFSVVRQGKSLQVPVMMEKEPDDFSSGEVEQDRVYQAPPPQGGIGGPTFTVNFGQ